MPELEKSGQQASVTLTQLSRLQRLGLHVVPRHRLPRMRIKVHLLVHPVRHRVAVHVGWPTRTQCQMLCDRRI